MGDERTYENCVALRAVESTDGMTADWVDLPYEFLQKVSNEIINNVKGINKNLLSRHPFPGPGLAIRILGDISKEKVEILQEVDFIFINELKSWNLYHSVWQWMRWMVS